MWGFRGQGLERRLEGRDAGLGVRKHFRPLRSGVTESHGVKGLVVFKENWINCNGETI